ncbi:MAG TPA: hypothetical protein VK202_05585 [Bacteroidia bacterium]|nr:hypothetical protein [Bacteroidia bacterium]
MKKLTLTLAFFVCLLSAGFASDYKLDEAAVDQMFTASTDVTFSPEAQAAFAANPTTVTGEKTVAMFLVWNFFCGGLALHRKYMGSDWSKLWWKYFCIPVAGGVASCGDFLYVLIKGQDALDNYDGNDDWFVWM